MVVKESEDPRRGTGSRRIPALHPRPRPHPDTAKYAAMVAADRDLRLSGYEVYRFGHDELRDETTARTLLEAFLPRLFQHHEVTGRH